MRRFRQEPGVGKKCSPLHHRDTQGSQSTIVWIYSSDSRVCLRKQNRFRFEAVPAIGSLGNKLRMPKTGFKVPVIPLLAVVVSTVWIVGCYRLFSCSGSMLFIEEPVLKDFHLFCCHAPTLLCFSLKSRMAEQLFPALQAARLCLINLVSQKNQHPVYQRAEEDHVFSSSC